MSEQSEDARPLRWLLGALVFVMLSACAHKVVAQPGVAEAGRDDDAVITRELENEALLAALSQNPEIQAQFAFAIETEEAAAAPTSPADAPLSEPAAAPASIETSDDAGRLGELDLTTRQALLDLTVLAAIDEGRLVLPEEMLGGEPGTLVSEAIRAGGAVDDQTAAILADNALRLAAYAAKAQDLFILNPYKPNNPGGGEHPQCAGYCLPCPGGANNCYSADNSFVVELRLNGARHCTAVALSKTIFLTAGHCLIDWGSLRLHDVDDLSVEVRATAYPLHSFALHRDYARFSPAGKLRNRNREYDIAVLKLSTPSSARAISLYPPSDFTALQPGPVPVTIAGFGISDAGAGNYRGPLFGKQFIPIEGLDLKQPKRFSFRWLHNLLRAKDASGHCKSDSGGPILKEAPPFSSDPVRLLGILSELQDPYSQQGEDPEVAKACYAAKGGHAVNLLAENVRRGLCPLLLAEGVACTI